MFRRLRRSFRGLRKKGKVKNGEDCSRKEEEVEDLPGPSSVMEPEVECPEPSEVDDKEDISTLDPEVGATPPLSCSPRRSAASSELADNTAVHSTSSYLDSYAAAFGITGHLPSIASPHHQPSAVKNELTSPPSFHQPSVEVTEPESDDDEPPVALRKAPASSDLAQTRSSEDSVVSGEVNEFHVSLPLPLPPTRSALKSPVLSEAAGCSWSATDEPKSFRWSDSPVTPREFVAGPDENRWLVSWGSDDEDSVDEVAETAAAVTPDEAAGHSVDEKEENASEIRLCKDNPDSVPDQCPAPSVPSSVIQANSEDPHEGLVPDSIPDECVVQPVTSSVSNLEDPHEGLVHSAAQTMSVKSPNVKESQIIEDEVTVKESRLWCGCFPRPSWRWLTRSTRRVTPK